MTREDRFMFIGSTVAGLALTAVLIAAIVSHHPGDNRPSTNTDECKGIAAGQVWEYIGGRENPFNTSPTRSVSKVLDVRGRYVKYEVLPGGDTLPKIDSDSCWWFTINRKPLP